MAMYSKDSGIYCIRHIASGKQYVGSAENFDRRFKKHLRQLELGIHHSLKLQNAWNKYGESAFEFVILLKCPIDDLLVREQEELDILDTVDNGYNVSKFAGSPMRGRVQSEEAKAKMRESHSKREPISEETRLRHREAASLREQGKKARGYVVSEEARANLSAALSGRIVSDETKAKISAANAGSQLTEEQRVKQIAALTGRALSDAHRAAIAKGATGRVQSEETRRKLSEKHTGKVMSDEARQKMREAKLKYWEAKKRVQASAEE